MTMWMVEYTYDDQAPLRDQHRPDHRAYLGALAAEGTVLAFGRFDDAEAPGALLIVAGDTQEDVEALIARDPFVIQGLVPAHRVRKWAGSWGAIPELTR